MKELFEKYYTAVLKFDMTQGDPEYREVPGEFDTAEEAEQAADALRYTWTAYNYTSHDGTLRNYWQVLIRIHYRHHNG